MLATLPESVRASGAGTFLQIVEELRRSYSVELRALLAVLTVDVENKQAVQEMRYSVEFGATTLDAERTHCHNIDRVATDLVGPLELAGNDSLAEQIMRLVQPLTVADNDYLDDITQVVGSAVSAAQAIDTFAQAGESDDARAAQQAFAQKVAPKLERMKLTLKTMNTLANDLIDAL